jgi:mRNA-degrading endonuclease toxin of MazEF toxin-antitoxin module
MELQIFDEWNDEKKKIETRNDSHNLYFKQGDIWWCSLGKNIGTESYGKGVRFRRPILVFKKLSKDSCIAIPLSKQSKEGSWFAKISLHNESRWLLLYQVRMINIKRFTIKIGELDKNDFSLVKQKLAQLLELL